MYEFELVECVCPLCEHGVCDAMGEQAPCVACDGTGVQYEFVRREAEE